MLLSGTLFPLLIWKEKIRPNVCEGPFSPKFNATWEALGKQKMH